MVGEASAIPRALPQHQRSIFSFIFFCNLI